jgi:NADPH:quinone reductase-like Zn-dependent oxidoreductase
MPRFPHEAAGYAEYVAAPSRQFARKPATLTHVEAAGLPLVGLTAWQSLVDTAHLAPGQRVLIHAAAGGVGHVAVQIAKALGAYVIGTSRAVKHGFLRALGADETIDYTASDVDATVRDVDVVLDLVGGHNSIPAIRSGGILVSIPGGPTADVLADAQAAGVRVAAPLVEPDRTGLEALATLVDDGKLRVHVDAALPLARAAEAHALGQAGTTSGKIVLTID